MTKQEPSLSPKHGIQTVRGFVFVCLGLFAFVVIVTFVVSGLVGSSDYQLKKIASFSGKDTGVAGNFTVKDNWEFRWEHNGHLDQIVWTRDDGHQDMIMEVMARKPIRQEGSLNYGEGGNYTMQVIGKGDWEIDIYQFP